jgi:hypothetical protein
MSAIMQGYWRILGLTWRGLDIIIEENNSETHQGYVPQYPE